MGLTEDDYYRKQFEIKGEIPEPLETVWATPMVAQHVPPRDWPPRGWEVDRKELEYIREAHKLQNVRVGLEEVEKEVRTETEDMCLDRYKVFLKQYNEWVAVNKDRLEEESYKVCNRNFFSLSLFRFLNGTLCFGSLEPEATVVLWISIGSDVGPSERICRFMSSKM